MVDSIIDDLPIVLGNMLARENPVYIARWVTQPVHVVSQETRLGQQHQLNDYGYLGDRNDLTFESRVRDPNQTIGTATARQIPSSKIIMTIKEVTGPSAGNVNDPSQPGHISLNRQTIMFQGRQFYSQNGFNPLLAPTFHQSIGSLTLLDDFRRWFDRVYLEKLAETTNSYNPQGVADGGTYASGPPRFDVDTDLNTVHESLSDRSAPQFDEGTYHLLCSNRFFKHLQQDTRFNELVQSSAYFTYPIDMLRQNVDVYAPAAMPGYGPGMMGIPMGMGVGGMMPAATMAPQMAQALGGVPTPFMGQMGGLPNYMAMPNQLGFRGAWGLGQASFGSPVLLPQGFMFRNFRIFASNNFFTETVNLTYTASTDPTNHPTGAANRTAYLAFAFGKGAIGEVMGSGDETGLPVRVGRNSNDDYQRFLNLIWTGFMDIKLIKQRYVEKLRTYAN